MTAWDRYNDFYVTGQLRDPGFRVAFPPEPCSVVPLASGVAFVMLATMARGWRMRRT